LGSFFLYSYCHSSFPEPNGPIPARGNKALRFFMRLLGLQLLGGYLRATFIRLLIAVGTYALGYLLAAIGAVRCARPVRVWMPATLVDQPHKRVLRVEALY
jgi:hypothetical protein